MKTLTKILLAAGAVAVAGTSASLADDGWRRHGKNGGPDAMERFEKADADKSGDVTFDEFANAMNAGIGMADANKDGTLTADEITAEIQKRMAERMAARIIERFDTDGDGKLTTAEVESRQKKAFAMLDRNDDGKIARDELPRRGHGRDGKSWMD
ncbi:MAG: acid-shock protein [Rhizobiaceae bacterium]